MGDAAAYLDPGTGSILFQSAIAVVASGVAVIVTARQAVVRFFTGLFNRNAESTTSTTKAESETDDTKTGL